MFIEFQNVWKSYGEQTVLGDVSFRVNPGERVGLIGPNGAGKSTIFGILTGEIEPDRGEALTAKKVRIGYLRQHLESGTEDVSLAHHVADALPEIKAADEEIHRIEAALANAPSDNETLLKRLGDAQHAFEALGGYEIRARAEAALCGLGFPADQLERPLGSFSGGWRMRANLARSLIAEPDILLLDEPSNYLDIPAVEWLNRRLDAFKGTLLLISHDRYLLNKLVGSVIEINAGTATRFAGDYDFYANVRQERDHQLESAKKNQDREKERMGRFIERFRSKNTKASLVKSQMKKLERMEEINLPDKLRYHGTLKLPNPPRCGHELIRLENIGATYNQTDWVLRNLDLTFEKGDKVALIGYNGTGKSTLMRVLAGSMEPGEGRRVLGHHVVIGYQAQDFGEILPGEKTALDVVRSAAAADTRAKVRNVLGAFGFSEGDVDKPCSALSGGEKIRLCFARIFVNPPNFLILDEPTTHLDVDAREALQNALRQYEGSYCLVSHDIEFVRGAADVIVAMTPPRVKKYYGNYDYYREKVSGGTSPSPTLEDVPEPTTSGDRKQRRQRRAEERKAIAKEKKQTERQVNEAEKAIERLESEKEALTSELESGTNVDFAAVNRKLAELQTAIDEQTQNWDAAAKELEAILERYDAIHEND